MKAVKAQGTDRWIGGIRRKSDTTQVDLWVVKRGTGEVDLRFICKGPPEETIDVHLTPNEARRLASLLFMATNPADRRAS